MHVTIEIGHQNTNDPNNELTITKSMMQQVYELLVQNKLPATWHNVE